MKKLKLKALELGGSELLSREQLKNVLGGTGSGYPCVYTNGCPNGGMPCVVPGETCPQRANGLGTCFAGELSCVCLC